ncbi:hypothetical protein ACGFOU_18150 [Streptomyces sp. NPDC048595]|uniref:hypothetical protein n=1 Tax=Streptomyces sp. NPDC048595 TaxID=3365576 RepID=UPI00371E9DF5
MSTPPTAPGRRIGRGLCPVALPLVAALFALPSATVARGPAPHDDRRTVAPDALPGGGEARREPPAPVAEGGRPVAVDASGQVAAGHTPPGGAPGDGPEKLLAPAR